MFFGVWRAGKLCFDGPNCGWVGGWLKQRDEWTLPNCLFFDNNGLILRHESVRSLERYKLLFAGDLYNDGMVIDSSRPIINKVHIDSPHMGRQSGQTFVRDLLRRSRQGVPDHHI